MDRELREELARIVWMNVKNVDLFASLDELQEFPEEKLVELIGKGFEKLHEEMEDLKDLFRVPEPKLIVPNVTSPLMYGSRITQS